MGFSSRKKRGGGRGSAYTHKTKQIQDKVQKKFEKGLDKDTLTLQKAAIGIGPGRHGPPTKKLPKLERNNSGTPIPLYSRNFALSSTAKNLNRALDEDDIQLIRAFREKAELRDVSQRLSRSSSASSDSSLGSPRDLNEETSRKKGGSGRNLRMKNKRTYRKRNRTRKTKRKLKTRRKAKI